METNDSDDSRHAWSTTLDQQQARNSLKRFTFLKLYFLSTILPKSTLEFITMYDLYDSSSLPELNLSDSRLDRAGKPIVTAALNVFDFSSLWRTTERRIGS